MKKQNPLSIVALAIFLFATFALMIQPSVAKADIGANQQVQLEAQLETRVQSIVEKVDPQALVRVHVTVKKVTSALPGVFADAQVTPLAADGSLGADGIDAIQVRVLTQIPELPQWVREEIKESLAFSGIRVDLKFGKAKGTFKPNANAESIVEAIKNLATSMLGSTPAGGAVNGSKDVTLALWGIAGGTILAMLFVTAGIFLLGKKIETTFFKIVDEKLAPIMQASGGGGGGRREKSEAKESSGAGATAQMGGRSGSGSGDGGEFAEVSNESLFALINDCYWTHSDGYANYIWSELNMKQREFLLAHAEFGKEYFRYFTYVRQFPAENLDYHRDVRYVEVAPTFAKVDQSDLAAYIKSQPAHATLVTPLRWDQLPISLADRLKTTAAMDAATDVKPVATASLKASKLRKLPRKLEVKTLSADDEAFLWTDPSKVPADLRGGLKTLVWLAQTSLDYRQSILREIDARDLAEAWSGPDQVLEKLKEAVPAKKFEMVQFFMKETQPDRDGAIFTHLVASGVAGLNSEASVAPEKKAAA